MAHSFAGKRHPVTANHWLVVNNDSDFRLALSGEQFDQYCSFNSLNEELPMISLAFVSQRWKFLNAKN